MFKKQSRHWKKLTLIFYSLIILMMAFLAYFNNQSFQSLTEKEYLVDHSKKVIYTIREILLALEDAETSQRGYIITGDSAYLKSYVSSLDSASLFQKQLKDLTLDNPTQQEHIRELDGFIKTKIDLLNVTILWKNNGEEAKIAKYFAERKGKRRMENVRNQLEKIVQTEETLLAKRNEEQSNSFQWMKGALYAIILITIFTGLLLYFLFRQQLRLQKSFEEEMIQNNITLSKTNNQLQLSTESVKSRNEQLLAMNNELNISKGLLTELNSRLEDRVAQRTQELSRVNSKNLLLLEQEKLNRMHLEFITNFIPEIVWQTLPNGDHDFFNKRWHEFTGLSLKESYKQAWTVALHPDDYENNSIIWQNCLASGTPYEAECRLRKADGSYRWFISRALPFKNEEGSIIKWIGTCVDMHDFVLQEQSLENQNKRLQEMNQYMDNFVHATAHDLRAPVANMQGLVHLLNYTTQLDGKQQNLVELLHQSVNRLDNTLRSLIKLIELQSFEISNKEKVAIEEVWESILRENQPLLEKTDHEVITDISSCKEATVVKPYLESIFRNLLTNSLKYKKEQESLVLKISCFKEGDFVLLKFQDNGIGIDLDKHGKNLFKPFARFTKQADGSGIGLHMINNMLRRMDGKIEVESKVGNGTTFKIYFKEDFKEKKISPFIKK